MWGLCDSRDEQSAIRTECTATDAAPVAPAAEQHPTAEGPDSARAVDLTYSDSLPVRAENNLAGMVSGLESTFPFARHRIPEGDFAVAQPGGQYAAVGAESHVRDREPRINDQ